MAKTAELDICPRCKTEPWRLLEIEQPRGNAVYCQHNHVLLLPEAKGEDGIELYRAAQQRYGLHLVPEGEGLFVRPDGTTYRIARRG